MPVQRSPHYLSTLVFLEALRLNRSHSTMAMLARRVACGLQQALCRSIGSLPSEFRCGAVQAGVSAPPTASPAAAPASLVSLLQLGGARGGASGRSCCSSSSLPHSGIGLLLSSGGAGGSSSSSSSSIGCVWDSRTGAAAAAAAASLPTRGYASKLKPPFTGAKLKPYSSFKVSWVPGSAGIRAKLGARSAGGDCPGGIAWDPGQLGAR